VGGADGFGKCLGQPKDFGDRGIVARLRLYSMEYSPTPDSLIMIFCSFGVDEEALEVWFYYGIGDV